MSIDLLPCSSANFVEFSNDRSAGLSCGQEVNRRNRSGNMGTQRRFSTKSYDASYVKNTVALAVITRLHEWCCRLFWLTIICVMGCCGELNASNKQKTLQDVRRSIANHKRSKTLSELEMQLLRHLTNPQSNVLRQTTVRRHKRRQLSRPPSPQLFAICEDEEPME
uniref:Uncharacterized protein n=1 Tax=Acrobeloides nanus TaxID=290746 RepID=A0A914DTR0_9BILA